MPPPIPSDFEGWRKEQGSARLADSTPFDPVADVVESIRNPKSVTDTYREFRSALFGRDPDKEARVTRLSRGTGEPPLVVEGREDSFERYLRASAFERSIATNPELSRFFGTNPRHAAAALDDSKSMGQIGDSFTDIARPKPTFGNYMSGLGTSVRATAVQAWHGANISQNDQMTDPNDWGNRFRAWLFPDMVKRGTARIAADTQRRTGISQQTQRGVEQSTPDFKSNEALYVYQGLSSLIQMAPGMAASIALRSPAPAVGMASAQAGLPAYAKYRARGATPDQAAVGATLEGGAEGAGELLSMGFAVRAFGRTGVGKFLWGFLGREMVGEQLTTMAQSAANTAIANPSATWEQYWVNRPEEAYATAIGVLVASGAMGGGHYVVQRAGEAQQARDQAARIDGLGRAAEESTLRQRDPEAYNELIKHMAESSGSSHVFVPGEVLREYMQSDSYDAQNDPFSSYVDQIEEAAAVGGDVVLPAEFTFGTLPGTAAWNAIKADIRFDPSGLSEREAQGFDDAMGEVADQLSAENTGDRDALLENVQGKLLDAGFTPYVARQYSELLVRRMETRAGRKGGEITAGEFDNVDVRQVLPPALAEARAAEQLDLVINAMRRGGKAARQGQSLLDFIASRGGIEDKGGNIASMGGNEWHLLDKPRTGVNKKGRPYTSKVIPGRKKLLKSYIEGQGSIIGGEFNPNSIEAMFDAAVSSGYFPDLMAQRENGSTYGEALDVNEFLNAIGAELQGSPIYASGKAPDQVREAAAELEQMLKERGLDPAGLSDAELRAAVAAMSEEAAAGGYEQASGEGARGRIQFKDDQSAVIELFQSRNLSTLLHEVSHLWLEQLQYDASLPGAPEQIKNDWQTAQDYFAANGHPLDENGNIPTEAHELWARSGERYFMEGKAPASGLKRLFETFRGWMVAIYKTVDKLRAPITPEIREVFDRLIATDEQIEQARQEQSLDPLFQDAATAGMAGPEFAAYAEQVEAARGEAQGELLDKTMAAIRARETKSYRAARKDVEAEARAMVDESPIMRAIGHLKAQAMNAQWVRDELGDDARSMLPRGLVKEVGVNPGIIAELVGYDTARDMVAAIMGVEAQHRAAREGGDKRSMRERMVQAATDAEMDRRYGDPLNDGSIEREALEAVHNEKQGEVFAAELRILSRRTNQRPTPYRIARDWARAKVRQGIYSIEASPGAIQRHSRAVAKAGREAVKALAAGKFDEAFRAKQQQMLSSALLSEAKLANDEVETARKRLANVAKNRKRDSIDPDYWDQAQAVLAGYDFIPKTEKLLKERESFERWAEAQRAAGQEIQIPERLAASGTNYTRMSTEEIIGIDAMVKSILHLGRRLKQLKVGKELRDWHEARGEWLEAAEPLPERQAGADRNAKPSNVRGIISNLVRIDMMAKVMDRGNPNGLMTRIFADGAKGADNTFARIQKAVLEPIADAYMALKGGRLFERISVPEWIDYRTGRPQVFLRSDLLAIAANLGTESNMHKMLAGEALLFKGQEHLAPTAEGVTAMLNRELNEAEWQMVVTGWRRVAAMGEEAFAAERELTGLTPEKVEPRMVETPMGTIEGGYWPAVYDTNAIRAGDAGVNLDSFKGDDFDALIGKHGIGTNKGYTISRTDFVAPMLLNYEAVLFGHVNQVAKRVAYQAWAKDALKVIRDRRVKAMWARKLGPEYHAQLEPWLRDTINQGQIANMGHLSEVNGLLRAARMNLTAMGLVFRATTMIAQVGGLPQSMKAIGAANVAKGFRLYAQDRGAMIARIMEASPLMARRMEEFDRDQAAALAEMRNPPTTEMGRKLKPLVNTRDKFNAAGFHLIGAIQLYTVDLPTWAGAYDKAMRVAEDGGLDMDHDEAVNFADRMVQEAQGAGRTAQLAAIQRSGEMSRIITLFYTFFGTVLNYQWEMTQDVRAGDYRKAAVSAGWVMVVAPLMAALIGDAVRGALPDDEDTWLAWAVRKVFFGMFSGIPIVRDFANQAERKASGKYAPDPVTPWQRIGAGIAGGGKDAFAAISQTDSYQSLQRNAEFLPEPAEVSDKWIKHGIEAVGFATGTGLGQVASTTQFVADVNTGDADPNGYTDWVEGLTTGKIKENN